jgi:HAD superfamily hydrolase (TIGR01509 family)
LRAYFGKELPSSEVERIGEMKERRYREIVLTRGVEPLPGVCYWLSRLKDDRWHQALASSASLLNVQAILEGLNLSDFFDTIVSAEDVQTGKPDPEVFLLAAARLSVVPSRCVVVEDAPAGIDAAQRAGMRAIGVRSSHDSLSADVLVRNLDELPEDAFDNLVTA